MPGPRETLVSEAEKRGWDMRTSRVLVAPGFGGEFKTSGVLARNGDWSLEAGRYSNDQRGESLYGVAGYQPWSVGDARVGGALGAYGQRSPSTTANVIMGLLASTPIAGGDLRAILSPKIGSAEQPGVFLSYNKSF